MYMSKNGFFNVSNFMPVQLDMEMLLALFGPLDSHCKHLKTKDKMSACEGSPIAPSYEKMVE